MVRNPQWSKTAEEFRADFRTWLALRDENAFMNVAIFYDAQAVAGASNLLAGAKAELADLIAAEPVMLAHFARAADQFPSPIGLFNNLVVDRAHGIPSISRRAGSFRSCTACGRSRFKTS